MRSTATQSAAKIGDVHPTCGLCGNPAKLVTGADVYPRMELIADKHFWKCDPCQSWVGCHPGTTNPLGLLANAEHRIAKSVAHVAFDPLWKSRCMTRDEAYNWLAKAMGIHRRHAHIGWFTLEECRRVVELCSALKVSQP
jgi:hypothetical protein